MSRRGLVVIYAVTVAGSLALGFLTGPYCWWGKC